MQQHIITTPRGEQIAYGIVVVQHPEPSGAFTYYGEVELPDRRRVRATTRYVDRATAEANTRAWLEDAAAELSLPDHGDYEWVGDPEKLGAARVARSRKTGQPVLR